MSRPRRVAHVLRKLEVEAWGGTETHVAEITRRLEDHAWSSEVHAPETRAGQPQQPFGRTPVRRFRTYNPFVGGAAARRALVASGGNLATLEEIGRLALDRRLGLAHLHTCGRIGGAVRTAMRLTRRRYVVSLHGPVLSAPDYLAREVESRLARVVDLGSPIGWALGARRVLDDAARVICFNDEEHEALSRRIGDRAVRMDHGVDVARLSAGDGVRARGRWPALGRAPLVLVLGRVCEQKNQLLAVRAFAGAAPRDHRLVLAGAETDAGYGAKVLAEAARLGIAERVHILGNVPRAEVPDLLACARLVLAPSQHEAFGLVALEAWAARRPILFARRHGLADVARALAHDAASVATLEPRDWTRALGALLGSEVARGENAGRGRALVERRFTWEAAVADLARLYDAVLES